MSWNILAFELGLSYAIALVVLSLLWVFLLGVPFILLFTTDLGLGLQIVGTGLEWLYINSKLEDDC